MHRGAVPLAYRIPDEEPAALFQFLRQYAHVLLSYVCVDVMQHEVHDNDVIGIIENIQ